MASRPNTEDLLKRLDEQHQAYLETFRLVHEALGQAATNNSAPTFPLSAIAPSKRRTLSTHTTPSDKPSLSSTAHRSSILTGESDESDDDGELYVQTPLPSYKFDQEHLRQHLKTHDFGEHGAVLLSSVVREKKLLYPAALFPTYPSDEKWHNSHYSVFDVGVDGAPLSRHEVVREGTTSIDSAIWQAIQDINVDPNGRKAVGRITIVREPSPIIFGALHLTMNRDFDMDELFYLLVDDQEDCAVAHLTDRAFSNDSRRQRSIAFKFDYHTIVGESVEPMPWQRTDPPEKRHQKNKDHVSLSRCTSVVALSLTGKHIKKLKNASRKAKTQHGFVHDPWAPWHVLNIQCYPDHKHSMDSHDSTKHYVNGPEAFLHTLLAEFKDAEKRLDDINKKISKLVSPPASFMFDSKERDKLLFEDEEFTYSRRYFWAFQTLGVMNNDIKAMVDAYRDNFTDEVWEGKHKTLWPMVEGDSARSVYWRKRMVGLRKEFERVVEQLEKLWEENDDRRKEIRTLRDQLFSGTSVQESRKSVELSEVTILQGHNIKLLTLVSIFFLPLTFVTSVFGMTNMPTDHQFKVFGIVMATVCVPFFLLIGSLNTTSGMEFWRSKWHQLLRWIFRRNQQPNLRHSGSYSRSNSSSNLGSLDLKKRSLSGAEAKQAIKIRQALVKPVHSSSASIMSVKKDAATNGLQDDFEFAISEPTTSTLMKRPTQAIMSPSSSNEKQQEVSEEQKWWEKMMRRKREESGREHNV
ncbi:uncharacterized protein PAC_14224 [Phialocephala subalpina]|uniref:Uncharacterized protein n=1 Tax=Phialocephala subalpina TaxID=576137 RepID=A0A1L7XHA0_9HELO|nr:uncharacterized protein PAC_14224 [Phialocephala subalpina]